MYGRNTIVERYGMLLATRARMQALCLIAPPGSPTCPLLQTVTINFLRLVTVVTIIFYMGCGFSSLTVSEGSVMLVLIFAVIMVFGFVAGHRVAVALHV